MTIDDFAQRAGDFLRAKDKVRTILDLVNFPAGRAEVALAALSPERQKGARDTIDALLREEADELQRVVDATAAAA